MNSENSKMSDPHRLILNLTDKINVKGSDIYVVLSNFSMAIYKIVIKNNLKYQKSSSKVKI